MKDIVPTLQAAGKIDRDGKLFPNSYGIESVDFGACEYRVLLKTALREGFVVQAMDAEAGYDDGHPDRIAALGSFEKSEREFVIRVANQRKRQLSFTVHGIPAETVKKGG